MMKTVSIAFMGWVLAGCGGTSNEPATPTATAEVQETPATSTPTGGTTASTAAPTSTPTAPPVDAKLELGKAVFEKNCVACHAAGGKGVIGPDLTDGKFIHGGEPKDILAIVKNGNAPKQMPGWGKLLKEPELDAVVAYVVSLSKKP